MLSFLRSLRYVARANIWLEAGSQREDQQNKQGELRREIAMCQSENGRFNATRTHVFSNANEANFI